jgi:very-short-patch-repair endonuclease
MIGQTNKKILSSRLQRKLRVEMTDAERALWQVLRDRQLSGLKFRRQHPFRSYILDFVCLENNLVIELDGGQHQQHVPYDEERTKALRAAGFTVLRFWNNEIFQEFEAVREKIWTAVRVKGSSLTPIPTPTLPLKGREKDL